jgi:hypothetical protein
MRGDLHVRFRERLRVRFPLPTRSKTLNITDMNRKRFYLLSSGYLTRILFPFEYNIAPRSQGLYRTHMTEIFEYLTYSTGDRCNVG